MRVKTKGLGWLKAAIQNDGVLEAEEPLTLQRALSMVLAPTTLSRILKEDKISNQVIILVNGADANLLGGLRAQLKDGDEITIIPVVHGG